jgi:hypothetical protein
MSLKSLGSNASDQEIAAQVNNAFSLVTAVIIDPGGKIFTMVKKLTAFPGAPVAWLIYNRDNETHTVVIDPASFRIMDTTNYVNPLVQKNKLSRHVNPGLPAIPLVANVRDDASFEAYKYDITSEGGTPDTLDPELDVVDP